MEYLMNFGDTNFIGVANAEQYNSFVDQDWEFDALLKHFGEEMRRGNALIFQMTEEGIEHSWKVDVEVNKELVYPDCYRTADGYMEVTGNELYLVDYDCLTMAAQFRQHKVPDKNCRRYHIPIEKGNYRVQVVQYYDVDNDEYTGRSDVDIQLIFKKVSKSTSEHPRADSVFWCTY
nr:hypothetical protein [Terribacillus goriensis]